MIDRAAKLLALCAKYIARFVQSFIEKCVCIIFGFLDPVVSQAAFVCG